MKKSLITMGIVILSSIILPITAVAAEYTSNGAIIFETDNDLTKPVDPTDPEKPVDPVDPTDPMGPIQELLGRCQLILPPVPIWQSKDHIRNNGLLCKTARVHFKFSRSELCASHR